MRDRMSVEAHKEAQAKVDAMQTRLETALADKAAMQATYQEKSTAMAKNTGTDCLQGSAVTQGSRRCRRPNYR